MKFRLFGFFFLSLCLASPAFAQNPPQGNITFQTPGEQQKDYIKIENYFPVSVEDPRIAIQEVSLDRRYSPDGRGEILDIMFYIKNNTDTALDLYVWVIAYYETNAVDEEERSIVPHPKWRVSDPDKNFFITRYIKITPKDIPVEKIWTPDDPDYKTYNAKIERMRRAVGHLKLISDIYPPVWKYVSYIVRYPTQGLPVTLYGDLGPAPDKLMETNYIPPTPDERRTKVFKNFPNHTYTVEYGRKRIIFRSHHYSQYRENFYFFNKFRILVFDAVKARQYEEQAERGLQPGETVADPLMFHRIYSITRKLEIR